MTEIAEMIRLLEQVKTDYASAHAEIVRLQGGDPSRSTWPTWSPQAHTLAWIDRITPDLESAAIAEIMPSREKLRELIAAEDVMESARKAVSRMDADWSWGGFYIDRQEAEKLAARAIQAERDRCAKIAETPELFMKHDGDFEGNQIAAAIRSSAQGDDPK